MTAWLKSRTVAAFTLLLSISLLSACGFHLRGVYEVPEEMRQLSLETGNADPALVRSLERALRQSGIAIQQEAGYQLTILSARQSRNSLTLNSSAQVDEYELKLDVEFEVYNLIQDVKDRRLLQAERIYSYDTNDATAGDEQEIQLREDMRESVAQQIIRHYLSLAPRQ